MCTLRTEQLDTLIQMRDAEGAGMRKEERGSGRETVYAYYKRQSHGLT